MDFDAIFSEVEKYATPYITVTGGEPLAQPNCIALLKRLCDQDYDVSLETSGSISLKDVDKRVNKVMDLKTPASSECDKNLFENLQWIDEKDQIKFVICNEQDYVWSKQQVKDHNLQAKCEILFSPSNEQLSPTQLADWILQDQLPVRFQMQLHKILWGDQPGK